MISVITEVWNWLLKSMNMFLNTKYHEIDHYLTEILFCGKRLTFLSREGIPGGLLIHGITCASLHTNFCPPPPVHQVTCSFAHSVNVLLALVKNKENTVLNTL